MQNKPIAWSYSSLEAFSTCPKQYYHLRVKKDFKDVPGEAALWGTEAHKHLELYATQAKELPEPLKAIEPMMQKIVGSPHTEMRAEQQYCFNKDFQQVEWFAKDAWCRGVVDLELYNRDTALLIDHKFGKRKPASDQLKLFAALVMTARKNITKVATAFLWFKERKLDKEVYVRDDVPVIWNEFLPRVRRLEVAYEKDSWPARPSGLCKKYCAVTSCEFNGRKG